MIRTLIVLEITILITVLGYSAPAPQGARAPVLGPPGCPFIIDGPVVSFGRSIRTLEELVRDASLIVDVMVRSNQSAEGRASRDTLFSVNQVLKGSENSAEITVSRFSAVGFFDMRPGQRFILFLTPNTRATNPRFIQSGGPSGAFCIDQGVVHLRRDSALKDLYEGTTVDKTLQDISNATRGIR